MIAFGDLMWKWWCTVTAKEISKHKGVEASGGGDQNENH